MIVAIRPVLLIGLFSDDGAVARIGAFYLRIAGPVYLCFGFGLGLFFVTQGVSRAVAGMNANAVRMITSRAAGSSLIYWLNLGIAGLFFRNRWPGSAFTRGCSSTRCSV